MSCVSLVCNLRGGWIRFLDFFSDVVVILFFLKVCDEYMNNMEKNKRCREEKNNTKDLYWFPF
jgi:hypothetical protein